MVYVMMGVSGSGKTAVGKALAVKLRLPFYDGDKFHPRANVAKMQAGKPLTDRDRAPWLHALAEAIPAWNAAGGAVVACSALKKKYRDVLRRGGAVQFIYLEGAKELISRRLRRRRGHFMPPSLLDSQFATLEVPTKAIRINVAGSIRENVADILTAVRARKRVES